MTGTRPLGRNRVAAALALLALCACLASLVTACGDEDIEFGGSIPLPTAGPTHTPDDS